MNTFKEIQANNQSISQRKLVFSFGINDSAYQVYPTIKGKRVACQIYVAWKGMIERCYCKKYQDKKPTYKGCSVSLEWKLFSKFREWTIKQDWKGKLLDKDLIISGNKVYSSQTCMFVSGPINALLNKMNGARGDLPIGVCLNNFKTKYVSTCCVDGTNKHLGIFDIAQEAHAVYLKFKSNHVHEIALQQADPRLKAALIRISGEISRGEYYK